MGIQAEGEEHMSIDAMKQALEALEAWNYLENPKPDANVIAALRAAIEQAQEPVAWLFQHEETGLTECVDTQQVDWGFEKNNPRWQKIAPLYTTPPQRKPLTNGEIYTAYITATNQTLRATDERLAFAFARAIEAAHGIKGEA
jgi:hypothetical protein